MYTKKRRKTKKQIKKTSKRRKTIKKRLRGSGSIISKLRAPTVPHATRVPQATPISREEAILINDSRYGKENRAKAEIINDLDVKDGVYKDHITKLSNLKGGCKCKRP